MKILPIHTKLFEANSKGSLLICGAEHGYSKRDLKQDSMGIDRINERRSFFSDSSVNNYPFRNTIVNWFKLWGYSLSNNLDTVTEFDKSIVQCNWLQTSANNMKGRNTAREYIDASSDFLLICKELKPSLIIFISTKLHEAFSSDDLSGQVEDIFGKRISSLEFKQNEVKNPLTGKNYIKFKIGFQKYEKVDIISLPHATGAQGLSHEYISSFKDDIRQIIDAWWSLKEKNEK